MVNLLARIFIKDYQDIEKEKVRTAYGVMCGIFGIVSNVILVIIKVFIGILSMSISIIADAINNLSDFFSSLLTLIGFKIASKPADKEHPFGHQRMEYVISLVISLIIIFVGIELLSTSIQGIITPNEIKVDLITYIILGISIFIKLIQGLFYYSAGKKINSVSLKASFKDSLFDCISTSIVLIGSLISKLINYNLDGILGSLVSVFIIISSLGLVKESISPLIGERPNKELIKNIKVEVLSNPQVLGIHDMIFHEYGVSKIFLSMHVELDANMGFLSAHELIDELELQIHNKYHVEIVMHMDPIEKDNEELNKQEEILTNVLSSIDKDIKFHDFRMVNGTNKINYIFDIVIPFNYKYTEKEIKNIIKTKLQEINPKIDVIINVDYDYL